MAIFLYKNRISLFLLVSFLALFSGVYFAYADETLTISAQVGSIPTPTPTPTSAPGAVLVIPVTAVRFSGEAYPNGTVFLLKDGVVKAQTNADALGFFSITLEESYGNNILYTLFAVDLFGQKSLLLNYPIVVERNYLTHLSGIRFTPTIIINKTEAHPFDNLLISGYAIPSRSLEIVVLDKNGNKKTFNSFSSKNGQYQTSFPLLNFLEGYYSVYVRYSNDEKFSRFVSFKISNLDKIDTKDPNEIPGDCNFDGKINLVDFSILSFWYKKKNPPACLDVNEDRIINLVDFSIFAYHWTG